MLVLRLDESGQSLVFGVMSIFIVLFFGAMVMGVGRVTARRVQMQFAADSAAYSAALVESECLNAIALLNTAMAQVRARALRYTADVNTYGVLAELRDSVLDLNDRLAEAIRQQITALQEDLADETDPQRRQDIQDDIDSLNARLASLYEDSDPTGDLLEATDDAFFSR